MATRIQVRRDTAANWRTSGSTTLASGEIGFETDTLLFKIGDGSQTWTNLEYAGGTEPIQYNPSGTSVTDLDAAALRNNGNGKYLILGAGSVSNGPSGLTTGTDGQLMVTVAKFDYTGTSAANERYLMTLQTLTTGRFFYRTYNGSWSSWYEAIRADPATGDVTIAGDLAVNGGDITTTSTGTATVFNTNATTLNVGQAATTVSIGATTGTATIRNATTAITGDATVGGTLAVTGNTTLTGDLAVNGGDITTTSATGNVFETNATTVTLGRAATTVRIADNATAAQTIDIGTGATVSGSTKTINIGTGGAAGSTTNVNIGDADGGTVSIARDLAVDTNVLKVDATNNRVGINVTSPTVALDVLGQLLVSGTASINGITLANMSGETKTNYLHFNPATTGTSQVGSVALVTARGGSATGTISTSGASSGARFGGSASVNSTNQVGMGLYTNSVAATVTVLVGGGVNWTAFESNTPISNAITLRPTAGTWSAIWCSVHDTTGSSQIFNLVMLAIRTA
jgi:hypothetical protein